MENGYDLAKALRVIPNRFLLVKVLAERVRQLHEGAEPFVEVEDALSVSEIALREIAQGKLAIHHLQQPLNE